MFHKRNIIASDGKVVLDAMIPFYWKINISPPSILYRIPCHLPYPLERPTELRVHRLEVVQRHRSAKPAHEFHVISVDTIYQLKILRKWCERSPERYEMFCWPIVSYFHFRVKNTTVPTSGERIARNNFTHNSSSIL